jgi:hypothetical protein
MDWRAACGPGPQNYIADVHSTLSYILSLLIKIIIVLFIFYSSQLRFVFQLIQCYHMLFENEAKWMLKNAKNKLNFLRFWTDWEIVTILLLNE